MLKPPFVPLLLCPLLVGCGMTSDVETMQDGSYLVAATNTPVFENPSDANVSASRRAQEFCAAKGLHAVVVSSRDSRADTHSSGFSGPSGGSGVFATGSASLNFKCS
jgi:hypothetical protein